jgi:DNA-binding transcriptional LysR family regulator
MTLVRGSSAGNIPIELLKTLVLIADLGSVTRAARELGVSQSAVSAQIRRLEGLVSGGVFVKQGRGVQLSERGRHIASYARRIVAISDQLQTVVGAGSRTTQIRIGLPSGIDQELIARLFRGIASALEDNPLITCDTPPNLLRALDSGFIDAAFLLDVAPIAAVVAMEWTEQWHWIKAPDFLLSPGAPVPLVGWPGSLGDRVSITALRSAGVDYRMTFTSLDYSLRKAAVVAGIGVMAASHRAVEASKLCVAREYYLPTLPELRAGIYLSDGFDEKKKGAILPVLESILRPVGAS